MLEGTCLKVYRLVRASSAPFFGEFLSFRGPRRSLYCFMTTFDRCFERFCSTLPLICTTKRQTKIHLVVIYSCDNSLFGRLPTSARSDTDLLRVNRNKPLAP